VCGFAEAFAALEGGHAGHGLLEKGGLVLFVGFRLPAGGWRGLARGARFERAAFEKVLQFGKGAMKRQMRRFGLFHVRPPRCSDETVDDQATRKCAAVTIGVWDALVKKLDLPPVPCLNPN
jgi:hypothetical protein